MLEISCSASRLVRSVGALVVGFVSRNGGTSCMNRCISVRHELSGPLCARDRRPAIVAEPSDGGVVAGSCARGVAYGIH